MPFVDGTTFVVYTDDPERLKKFLASFGLEFMTEKHGDGPVHYSTTSKDGLVLEVYPKKRKPE